MDADEDSKHNQKYVRKDSQVLYEIISGTEIDYGGQGCDRIGTSTWKSVFYEISVIIYVC